MARPRSQPAKPPPKDTEQIRKAIAKGEGGIDSGLLLNSLLECWGGPQAFARDIFTEFQSAKSGGLTRQKILELVSRLTIVVTNQEIAKPKRPDDMTDAELVAVAGRLLERLDHDRPDPPAEA